MVIVGGYFILGKIDLAPRFCGRRGSGSNSVGRGLQAEIFV